MPEAKRARLISSFRQRARKRKAVATTLDLLGPPTCTYGTYAHQWVCEACLLSDTVERLVHTGTVNVLGVPNPVGSLGDEETLPWTGARRIHSFATPAEALALADRVHTGAAPRGWWRRLRAGYLDSKLAADLLVARYARDRALPAVRVLPGTCFGPHDRLVGNGLYLPKPRAGEIPAVTPGTGLPCAGEGSSRPGQRARDARSGAGRRSLGALLQNAVEPRVRQVRQIRAPICGVILVVRARMLG